MGKADYLQQPVLMDLWIFEGVHFEGCKMTKYYLPRNYSDSVEGAKLYLEYIKLTGIKEKLAHEKRTVTLIRNYHKNKDMQPIRDALENGKELFCESKMFRHFASDVANEYQKEKKQRKKRISATKKPVAIAQNKKGKYNVKYYVPKGYPRNHEGLRLYVGDLFANGSKNKLLLFQEVTRLIDGYHRYKEKQPLLDAIKNKPELFKSEMFRNFVADISSQEYHPMKKGAKNKRTEENHQSTVAHVEYYKNMGIPVFYESGLLGKPNACQLTADKLGLAKTSVEGIYKKRNSQGGWTSYVRHTGFNDWDDRLWSTDGNIIWVLNGFRRPESEEVITRLEKILKSLPKDKYKKLEDFSWSYDTRETKLPKTRKELKRRKKLLSKREHYDLVKSLQIKEISLKT